MSRDYHMLQYIDRQTQDMPTQFQTAIRRIANRIDQRQLYASGLSTGVTLFLAAKLCGLAPKLILGTITHDKVSYTTAWVEIDKKVFDLAVYGDTKYNPYIVDKQSPVLPQVNLSYLETDPVYYPRQFAQSYYKDGSGIKKVVGKTFFQYAEENPYFDLFRDVCYILGLSETPENLKAIEKIAKSHIIEDGNETQIDVNSQKDKVSSNATIQNSEDIKQNKTIVKPIAEWLAKK